MSKYKITFVLSLILILTTTVVLADNPYPGQPDPFSNPLPFGSELIFAAVLSVAGVIGFKRNRKKNQ